MIRAAQHVLVAELSPDSLLLPLAKRVLATLQKAQRPQERHLATILGWD
ncbi:MAG TPA: hypothetical protein VE690_05825 [Rhodopila sp.]|jgi:hypothetical protein|nr:hypothetical protein [Rhodopila sp.]